MDNRRYVDEKVFLFSDNCRVVRAGVCLTVRTDTCREGLTLTCDTEQTAILWHKYCSFLIDASRADKLRF